VLLVEDDDGIASVVADVLSEERHAVTRASSRREGLALAVGRAFDLVLTDSFGHGYEQPSSADLSALRALASQAPVVLLTAHDWARRFRPEELGVAAIVRKPFDLDELLATVRRVVGPEG
jgi:DNA-binding response OmpR family regulator